MTGEPGGRSRRARVAPLVLATMASQAMLVVLAPTITAIGEDFDHSVAAVGQARSVTAAVAIAASLVITARIGVIGVRRLIVVGGLGALVACAAVAPAPSLGWFLAAYVLVALAFACVLPAGFAGVVGLAPEDRAVGRRLRGRRRRDRVGDRQPGRRCDHRVGDERIDALAGDGRHVLVPRRVEAPEEKE